MNLAFGKANYLIITLGVGLAVYGMYLLSIGPVDNQKTLNLAPIVLGLAYLVVIPAGILFPNKGIEKVEKNPGQSAQS